jgi:hypothetical protein
MNLLDLLACLEIFSSITIILGQFFLLNKNVRNLVKNRGV